MAYNSLRALICVFLTSSALAQITITEYDMPSAVDTYLYQSSADLLLEDFTVTGANQTWDYSVATGLNSDTAEATSVTSTPFAYQVFFNNVILYPDHKADYALVGADIDLAGQLSVTDRFDYYKKNSNSLEIVGFGANINGIPASVKYDTIDQIYPLSMSFGDPIHYSSGYYLTTVQSLGTYGQWINREVEVDGFGSLTTPNDTYQNTLRVKTTLYQTDTIYVDQFGFGQLINRPVETKYEWFTNTETMPVMVVTQNGSQTTEVKYLGSILASLYEYNSDDVLIQRTNENEYLFSSKEYKIQVQSVFNIEGKMMNFVPNKERLNITLLPEGIYIVNLLIDGKEKSVKIIK